MRKYGWLIIAVLVLAGCGESGAAEEKWSFMCDGFPYTMWQGHQCVCANSYRVTPNYISAYRGRERVAGFAGIGGSPVTVIHKNGSVQVYE